MGGRIDQLAGVYGDTTQPSSQNIEKKTQTQKYAVKQSVESNVLNGYRSYTYNFTMAALSLAEINDPTTYRGKPLSRVILKSGGKGIAGINEEVVGATKTVSARTEGDTRNLTTTKTDSSGADLVKNFNEKSPGRFDMFIDNVEFENLMAFDKNSSVSLPTGIKFEIIEPYSISGFIEALQVAAVSAGYPNYLTASFVLKMEFLGYPDNVSVEDSQPVSIPNSTRYFMFKFTGVSLEVTQQGARYRCAAVPWGQAGFGQPNKLKKPIKIEGTTVKEILDNFMTSLNTQVSDGDKDSKDVDKDKSDVYSVVFPSVTATGFDFAALNELSTSNISEFQKNNTAYAFNDISISKDAYDGPIDLGRSSASFAATDERRSDLSVNPSINKPTVNFREGAAIHECIAAIIRDSKYGSDIIKNIKKPGFLDPFGFFNYFLVNIEVTNLLDIDATRRKPRQKFTYVITPYRMHYTAIPLMGGQSVDVTALKQYISLREYNYLYTGKNIDVLDFKINFNTLFFEAVPYAMGNNDRVRTADTMVSPGGTTPSQAVTGAVVNKNNIIGTPVVLPDATSGATQPDGGSGNAPQTDPYTVMSRAMHEAIINSPVGLVTGEISIIGDPFFLVTGGQGNYNPKLENIGKTVDGESAYNYGEVYVTVNFRNPIDISTIEEGGQLYFSKENVQFSGVYKVTRVYSTFKSGQFTQRLELMRLPGQISDNTPVTDPKKVMTTNEDLQNAPAEDTSQVGITVGTQQIATVENAIPGAGAGSSIPGLRGLINLAGEVVGNTVSGLKIPVTFNPLPESTTPTTSSPLSTLYSLPLGKQ